MNNPHLIIASAFYRHVFKDFIVHDPLLRSCYKTSARYLKLRLETEGLGFISNSLPKLGKACEISLMTGSKLIRPAAFSKHWRSELPNFLYELFIKLFDDSGHPRMSETQDATWAFYVIRQVCLAFSKAKDIPSKMTVEEAFSGFRDRVSENPEITAPSWLLNEARRLITCVLMDDGRLHPSLAQWAEEPYGRHGPGAVACKERGLNKWKFRRIDGSDVSLYRFNDLSPLPQGVAKPISRAICVPKDYKSLRVICAEPKEFQFAQQGLWDVLKFAIHANHLSRKSINFNHQEYNGRLCKREDLATIDLKDASDTVRLKLCRLLLPKEVFRLVTRYRSREISINGDRVRPTCLASMGSALCFPMETLLFWAIARAACHPNSQHKPLRVFGDDIVASKEDAPYIAKVLEQCGFRVNHDKTCINTPIRESCGSYTYAGNDVSIVRFKASRCESALEWISLTESCKLLERAKLSKASYAILCHLKQFWHVPFGRFGFPESTEGFTCQSRWNYQLQRREWRLPGLATGFGNEKFTDNLGLYAWLVGNSTKPRPSGSAQAVKVDWIANY